MMAEITHTAEKRFNGKDIGMPITMKTLGETEESHRMTFLKELFENAVMLLGNITMRQLTLKLSQA